MAYDHGDSAGDMTPQGSNGSDSDDALSPPHNLDAEAAVIGALLFDNKVHMRIGDILHAQDFYHPVHAEIYGVADKMIVDGKVADGVTLREYFERHDQLTDIGGAVYLAELLESAAFGPEVVDYARLIKDLALRRELAQIGAEISHNATQAEPEDTGADQIEFAEKKLFALAERGATSGGFVDFGTAVGEAVDMAAKAFERDSEISGIATGLNDLDRRLGGFHDSDLIIIAARPSMGKTSLATNIAYHAARHCRREEQSDGSMKTVEGAIVGFFSLEMSSEQLAARIMAEVSRIPSDRVRRGDIKKNEFEQIKDAAIELESIPLYIDETGGISISQLAARARRLQRTRGLDMLIIDYLQLITASGGNRSDGRVQEVTQITQALKALAKELSVPIIALAQLSRAVELRDDKRPQLSDLRESGSIEQDADVVMFIYREEYYKEREEPTHDPDNPSAMEKWTAWRAAMDRCYGKAEIIVGKQRHGPIGKIEVAYNANITKFGNLMEDDGYEAG